MTKMNTLLAVTSAEQNTFNALLKDYVKFFKGNQGAFLGERKTYEPKPDTVDEPTRRGNIVVQSTVDEKLEWFAENSASYLNNLFTLERGNANNITTELIIGEESWGQLTTLELLRLKGLLENNALMQMCMNIPVRSDSTDWNASTKEQYKGRNVFESPLISGENKTTDKETYVLVDPNVGKLKDAAQYIPQLGSKNTVRVLGDFTVQKFSGEWSQRQKAELLRKRNELYTAVIEALKVANEAEVSQESNVGSKLLNYLF